MRWLVRLNLINHTDRANSFFDGNDIASMIAATGRKCHFFKSGVFVCASYYFLPFLPRELKSYARVSLQKRNDVEPRASDRLD